MSVYSTNQVRHLYVANAVKDAVTPTDAVGTIAAIKQADTDATNLYFSYKGADTVLRSDVIDLKNLLSIKATKAEHMAHKLKAVTVTLDNSVNSGTPIGGQDYILRIAFRQYIGMSDEDLYFKYGNVHAYTGMSASDFYKEMAVSLAKNFTRELAPLVNITLVNSSDGKVPVLKDGKIQKFEDATFKSILIEEVEQEWTLGIKEQVPVYFTVQSVPVVVDGDERTWATVANADSPKTIGNGKKIPDLEYFCMGERGDIYRNIGWPKSIPTKYLVDPTKVYNVIDIHYAYVGSGEGVQKSEKTLTIVVPASDGDTLTTNLITKINQITGLSTELK